MTNTSYAPKSHQPTTLTRATFDAPTRSQPARLCDDHDAAAAENRLADDVKRALRRSGYLELSSLTVCVYAEDLVIEGSVRTYHLKQVAQAIAQSTAHSKRVRNDVQVI